MIFGQISVGPNCGSEPHLSRWFSQHSNAKGEIKSFVDPLPPLEVAGADVMHIGHVLFLIHRAHAVEVDILRLWSGTKAGSIPRATARNKMSPLLYENDTQNISQIILLFFFTA